MTCNQDLQDKNVISPILLINYDEDRSMRLNWNFYGMRNTKIQIYNLFVFSNTDLSTARSIIKEFYSQSRLGDLIGIATFSSKKNYRCIHWVQKSSYGFDEEIITERHLSGEKTLQTLKEILPKFKSRKGLNFLNIYNPKLDICQKPLDHDSEKNSLEQFVTNWKSENQSCGAIILNLFAQRSKKNELNIKNNVNLLSCSGKSPQQLCQFLKKYENSVRFWKMCVRLRVLDPDYYISFSRNQGWVNTDFDTVQKSFSCLPAIQIEQKLHVCIPDLIGKQYPETIKCRLEFSMTFLDGDICQSCQQFQLFTDNGKNFHKTVNFNANSSFQPYEIHKGQIFYINLSDQEHYVFLKKQKRNSKRMAYQNI